MSPEEAERFITEMKAEARARREDKVAKDAEARSQFTVEAEVRSTSPSILNLGGF